MAEATTKATATDERTRIRRSFVGTTTLGLAAGVLAAVAGNRAWATVPDDGSFAGTQASVLDSIDQAKAPLVTAVALVALACWGVELVTRGRFRRVITWLGAVAAVAVLVAAVVTWVQAPRTVRHTLAGTDDAGVHHTAWSYVALVAGVLLVVAALVAVRRGRSWPEMGRRYDAPTGAGGAVPDSAVPVEEQTNLDIWKAMDEGRDPTEGPAPLD